VQEGKSVPSAKTVFEHENRIKKFQTPDLR
jgi:hypothetical protein